MAKKVKKKVKVEVWVDGNNCFTSCKFFRAHICGDWCVLFSKTLKKTKRCKECLEAFPDGVE